MNFTRSDAICAWRNSCKSQQNEPAAYEGRAKRKKKGAYAPFSAWCQRTTDQVLTPRRSSMLLILRP